MPRVYAKARNNDPAVPYNSREKQFKSGKGYAVDIQVRDYNGSAAQRYAEGVIIGFWESEAEARRVAEEVNSGKRYEPGHHLHTRAHNAIVIPAWNGPDLPDDVFPWETREGSSEMVATYQAAGVPIPQWLSTILGRLGNNPAAAVPGGSQIRSAATSITRGEPAKSNRCMSTTSVGSARDSGSPTGSLEGDLFNMISEAVGIVKSS